MKTLWMMTLLLLLLPGPLAPPAFAETPGKPGRQQPTQLDACARVRMGYLLYLPTDYENQKAWPLLLFLHGSGERGADLELAKRHGPPKLVAAGKQFPFIVVSPQCPNGQWWQPVELIALVDEVVKSCKVDEDRIYVTGLSMGGFGAWALAAYRPNRFAAVAPICGGGEVYWAEDLAELPVWAFHGAKDRGVPPERSREMVEAINKHGGHAKLTIYPNAGHDAWTETYNNPKLYEWLLEHKRGAKHDE